MNFWLPVVGYAIFSFMAGLPVKSGYGRSTVPLVLDRSLRVPRSHKFALKKERKRADEMIQVELELIAVIT